MVHHWLKCYMVRCTTYWLISLWVLFLCIILTNASLRWYVYGELKNALLRCCKKILELSSIMWNFYQYENWNDVASLMFAKEIETRISLRSAYLSWGHILSMRSHVLWARKRDQQCSELASTILTVVFRSLLFICGRSHVLMSII